MRVAIFNGPGRPITLEHAPDPRPGPDDVLVQICRCGICGSDISMTEEGPFSYKPGAKMGHEYAGEVVEIGRNVTGVKLGDRVAVAPWAGCGACPACAEGRPQFCPRGKSLFGAFGDYSVAPPQNLVILPESLSLADGALVEPMACGLRALRQAGMRGGERILVLGAGAMAIAITYWARLLGAGSIVVASRSLHRREINMAMGADAFCTFDQEDMDATLAKYGTPDIVVECVGKVGMLNKAVDYVRVGGSVISLGMCGHAEPIIPARCTFKELKLFFPVAYSLGEFFETAKAFEAGSVNPELMVSSVIPLDALPATIEELRQGARSLKVHVDPRLEAKHVQHL